MNYRKRHKRSKRQHLFMDATQPNIRVKVSIIFNVPLLLCKYIDIIHLMQKVLRDKGEIFDGQMHLPRVMM